ncbi:MAG: hypothetical protein SF066_19805 [Thermoanaerobaculia bacterium]|nr:hypothetical protein [Thermoanaerobaculia bacterium]
MRVRLWVLIPLFILLTGTVPAFAQGTGTQTLNFEPPVHKPIQVVRVGTRDFLLVANVSDDSVEVYDTVGPNFLFRVPTGQAPVTIAVRPTPTATGGRQIYTANWLGDSVTVFEIDPAGTGLTFRLVTTEPVGDEPIGLAFLPANPAEPGTLPGGPFHELLLVTFSTKSQWGVFSPGTVQPILSGIELLDSAAGFGVKDPRAIAFAPTVVGQPNRMWVLNFRGGNTIGAYDYDLWGSNNPLGSAANGRATQPILGGIGTTNFQMAFVTNGDLWVVGQQARNLEPVLAGNPFGENFHRNQVLAETGFVTSYVARVRNLDTVPAVDFLDLNDSSQGTLVPPQQALQPVVQPTDVVAYPNGSRVFVTGFNSDSLAMIRPTAGSPSGWTVVRANLAPPNAISVSNPSGAMRGPRGLALRAAGVAPTLGDRLYVYNRVDNSVTVVNPVGATPTVLANFPLRGQVEPAAAVTGRKFLYSSRLSGTGVAGVGGNVSCASCHIDGKSDHLSWDLSSGTAIPPPVPSPPGLPGSLGPNAAFKGLMLTQTFQGLVNFEVIGSTVQDFFFSNRPYHWRGDKGTFEQFNAAFVNLMGAPNITSNPSPPTNDFNMGIEAVNMTEFRNFVFSIHYPPNPEQPFTREYSGDLGNPGDTTSGTAARLGLKAFHQQPSFIVNGINISCVHCHTLPEGSNNRFTDTFDGQDLETAQLRGLRTKEKRLERYSAGVFTAVPGPAAVTGQFGLTHSGLLANPSAVSESVTAFLDAFGISPTLRTAIAAYGRELDTGVAPSVGFTATVDPARYNAPPAATTQANYQNGLAALEQQARLANAGLAVHAVVGGRLRGFWFDANQPAAPYREEPQPGLAPIGPFTGTQLLNLLSPGTPGDLQTYHFTPLGSARRVARVLGGLAPPLATTAPGLPTLLAARPNTANVAIPSFQLNWGSGPGDLIASEAFLQSLTPNVNLLPQQTVAYYQMSLMTWAPQFGLTNLRHETPRRFAVSGPGIQEGAFLVLTPPTPADIASGSPPTTTPAVSPWSLILPVFPRTGPTGTEWESAAEMEPLYLLALMNGGPWNGPVVNALLTPDNQSQWILNPPVVPQRTYAMLVNDVFRPNQWNWHFVQVANQTPTGLQLSPGSWQRLTIQ